MAENNSVGESHCVMVCSEDDMTHKDDTCLSAEGAFGDKENAAEGNRLREIVLEGEARLKRQIKKDDSGISVEKSENSSEDDASKRSKRANDLLPEIERPPDSQPGFQFPKLKAKAKNRSYRSKTAEQSVSSDEESGEGEAGGGKENIVEEEEEEEPQKKAGRSSPDSGSLENGSAVDDVEMEEENPDDELAEICSPELQTMDSEESNDSTDSHCRKPESESDWEETPNVLMKPKPKHKWFVMQEVVNRQRGVHSRFQGPQLFQQRCYGSLHAVQRLELMYKLEGHHGCVNALHFNSSGSLLASGSDDLNIVVWDWPLGKILVTYDSGHRSNVFQVKFLPFRGDTHLVSCGRDGQIRLAEMSSTGVCRATRRLGSHRGPAHKLAMLSDTPHVFLSSGEDGIVLSLDVRLSKPHRLLTVQQDGRNIALYSIHANPINSNEFCVCGRNSYIRIYDRRKVTATEELKKFCPTHLRPAAQSSHVTCAVFNYNGTEILGSFNDEDIYLFDTRNPDAEYIHKYEGHRNSATVKGLTFFGPRSEYVVSGSDCGNIFFWDKSSEAIVQWMAGDENGVVNCLETHPQIPVIATSGLDDDVKIWVPSCEQEPKMDGLKSTIVSNQKAREDDRQRDPDAFDGQMLWILWRHIRRTERRRQQQQQQQPSSAWNQTPVLGRGRGRPARGRGTFRMADLVAARDDTSSSESSNTSEEEDESHRIQCSPS